MDFNGNEFFDFLLAVNDLDSYTNLKTWINDVCDLMTCRRNSLVAQTLVKGMFVIACKLNPASQHVMIHSVVLVEFTVHYNARIKELCSLKKFLWLVLIGATYIKRLIHFRELFGHVN